MMTPREIALSICEPWFNGDPCEGCECHKVCTKLVERIEIAIRAERVPETNFGNIPQPVAYISGYHKGRCIIEPVGYANKKGLFRCADDADEAFKASAIPLYATPPKREPLTEAELEPIRRRMMMEAYNAADDGDSERYNALKVMANDVLDMLLGVRND